MVAVKIRTYTAMRKGERGLITSLPAVWTKDVGIKSGDKLDIYRDENDRLIIEKAKEA